MTKTPLEEKIAMLLAKAEATDSPHEAEAYTEAAEKLMIKHGIDRAVVEARGEKLKVEPIITEKIRFEGKWQTAWTAGFSSVVRSLGLSPLQLKYGGVTTLYVVGYKRDVTEAVYLINSLQQQSETALAYWWKRELPKVKYLSNHERHVEKRSFMQAFGTGAASRIREERKSQIKNAGTGAELVLVSRREKIEAYVLGEYNPKSTKRRGHQHGFSGMAAGIVAGRAATTQKSIV